MSNFYKEVESVILDYIKKEKTDYAILLNGDWGCGKTYFIDEILKKEVEKEKKKKLMYISAAGITDITGFINDIYLTKASNKIDNKHALGVIKAIAKYSSYAGAAIESKINFPVANFITEAFKDINKNIADFSNTLIVIDDLERISETIKTEDFLYRIYDTFISQNVKVLFVAYEKEIEKDNEKSEYKKIKEKIIRHTIGLHDVENGYSEDENNENKSKSFENIIDSIIKNKIKDNEKYIKKYFINEKFFNLHIENIKYLFNEREHFNLRTFLTYLSLAEKILPIDDRLKKHYDILRDILNTLCLVLIELNSKNRDLLKEYSDVDKANCKILSDGKQEDTVNFKNYHNKINKLHRYIGLGLDSFGLISNNFVGIFIKYIETGYLNEKAIKREYEHIIIQDEEYQKAYNIFTFGIYNDGKYLEESIKVIISKIENNPKYFSIDDFINIYNGLETFNYLIDNAKYKKYKDTIKSSIKDEISKLDKEKIEDFHIFGYRNIDRSSELYSTMKKAIGLVSNKMDTDFREKLLDIFNNSDDIYAILHIDERYNKKYTTTFETICSTEFLKEINVKPFSITSLKRLINSKILSIVNANQYINEHIPALENLEKYVNELDYNSYDMHLQKQIDTLKEEIEKAKEYLNIPTS